ncbi:MAG: hypothetical protein H6Q67_628 [Firmicutes bacterium]|nr:hypothetical protein [Bacillota bacterium]
MFGHLESVSYRSIFVSLFLVLEPNEITSLGVKRDNPSIMIHSLPVSVTHTIYMMGIIFYIYN